MKNKVKFVSLLIPILLFSCSPVIIVPIGTNIDVTTSSLLNKTRVNILPGVGSELPSVYINKDGNGLIAWSYGARKIINYQTTGEQFIIGDNFGNSDIYVNSKGNGLAVWYERAKITTGNLPKIRICARYIKNYLPYDKEIILNDELIIFGFNEKPKIHIDEQDNGIILWKKNSRTDSEIIYSTQIRNLKLLENSSKQENINSFAYYVKNENDNFVVKEVAPKTISELNNLRINGTFLTDDNGDGAILITDNDNSLYLKKIKNGIIEDNKVKILGDIKYNYQIYLDNDGNGFISWINDKKEFLMKSINNFSDTNEVKIIDNTNKERFNSTFAIDKKGRVIFAWKELNNFPSPDIFAKEMNY